MELKELQNKVQELSNAARSNLNAGNEAGCEAALAELGRLLAGYGDNDDETQATTQS